MKRFLICLIAIVALTSCESVMTSSPSEARSVMETPSASSESEDRSVMTETVSPTLCLVGDSRVFLWSPTDLATYFPNWAITNIGVGGTTSFWNACRINLISSHYDVIIISVGINDIGADMSLVESVNSLIACVQIAKTKATKVYITSIPGCWASTTISWTHVQDYSYRAGQLNTYIPIIANNLSVNYIPLAETIGYGWYLHPKYADASGIHYNSAGYAKIAELYNSILEE